MWRHFPSKKYADWFNSITFVEFSASLNHCKVMNAEPGQLIPYKLTNLELLIIMVIQLQKCTNTV